MGWIPKRATGLSTPMMLPKTYSSRRSVVVSSFVVALCCYMTFQFILAPSVRDGTSSSSVPISRSAVMEEANHAPVITSTFGDNEESSPSGVVNVSSSGRRQRRWQKVRSKMFDRLGEAAHTCKFYERDEIRHDVRIGTHYDPMEMEMEGGEDHGRDGKEDDGNGRIHWRISRMRKQLELQGDDSSGDGGGGPPGDTNHMSNTSHSIDGLYDGNVTYVHVGKAGGSSMGCNIRESRRYAGKHCHTPFPSTEHESAISKKINCYTHYDKRMHCYDVNRNYIINVRNPVHRMASWFLYEHPENHHIIFPKRKHSCGELMLYTCYRQLDELATVGLDGATGPQRASSSGGWLRVGMNLTEEECTEWAWAAVRGDIPATYHNVWNYEWYAGNFLNRNSTDKVYVVRIEHLREDWMKIDTMLGGTGDPMESGESTRQNTAASKPLPISNNTISPTGIRNLCRVLCDEIQVYKRILARAANLEEEDLATSMEELREVCPEEVDITERTCTY